MELKKSWDFRKFMVGAFFTMLTLYLLIGLTPAKATEVDVATEIKIPKIGLSSDVTLLTMNQGMLKTPDVVVGSYSRNKNKTFLVGHSTGVFGDLDKLELGDEIYYDLVSYTIVDIDVLQKSDISMDRLLAPADIDTIVVMTCAGELFSGGDASHRLIITAVAR